MARDSLASASRALQRCPCPVNIVLALALALPVLHLRCASRWHTILNDPAGLKSQQMRINDQWVRERDEMNRVKDLKEEIERVNVEVQQAERDYDLNRAAELKYGTLMELQKKLKRGVRGESEAVKRAGPGASVKMHATAGGAGCAGKSVYEVVRLIQSHTPKVHAGNAAFGLGAGFRM
eukprot:351965-Chlamydomonas_euryale.AAC.11